LKKDIPICRGDESKVYPYTGKEKKALKGRKKIRQKTKEGKRKKAGVTEV